MTHKRTNPDLIANENNLINANDAAYRAAHCITAINNVNLEAWQAYSGVGQDTIDRWFEEKLIEKVRVHDGYIVRPTYDGRNVFSHAVGMEAYTSTPETYKHDRELFKVYIQCDDEELQTWKTERDLRLEVEGRRAFQGDDTSCVDACYVDSMTGELQMVEIISPDYKPEMISAKIHFVELYGGHYDPHTF